VSITDEFFNQLDLSQMGRTQDEVKTEIIKMFSSGRLDRVQLHIHIKPMSSNLVVQTYTRRKLTKL
jgi:hypothetical protein